MRQTEKWLMAKRTSGWGWAKLHREIPERGGLDAFLEWQRDWDCGGWNRNWDAVQEHDEKLKAIGGWAISVDEPNCPHRLREMVDVPGVLFGLGDPETLMARRSVSVVGTRRCSPYGRVMAKTLGFLLAEAGAQVVNGLAAGIDAAALQGGVESGRGGVACLGHGLESIHPKANTGLAAEMLEKGGALLTEFEMESAIHRWHFAARNRITVGLSDTLVVIESPARGGSMISVEIALDLGVNLFVLVPPSGGKRWAGNQQLIDAFPSTAFSEPKELVDSIFCGETKEKKTSCQPPTISGLVDALPPHLRSIWIHLIRESGSHLATCAQALSLPEEEVRSLLLGLEMMGWAIRSPGGVYLPVVLESDGRISGCPSEASSSKAKAAVSGALGISRMPKPC